MKENTFLGHKISFAVAITASLILGAHSSHDVGKLVTVPVGMDIYAPAGVPFNITCQGVGGDDRHRRNKFSSMKWVDPKGDAMPEGIPGVVKGKSKSLILAFLKPTIKDSGTYTCKAVYDNEINIHRIVNVEFYGPKPEFDRTFENISATEGETVELDCFARGEKPITYDWYNQKEDKISENSDSRISVLKSGNSSTLIIQDVTVEDGGVYTCTASNAHGLISKVYLLHISSSDEGNVTDVPPNDTSSSFNVKVVNVSENSVQFEITTTKSAEYIEVKYTEIRVRNETVTRLTPASKNVYSLGNLIPGGLYSFQFRAVPSENSSWSEVYNVTLLPAEPEVILVSLGNRSIKLQWTRTFDDVMRETIDMYEIRYYMLRRTNGTSWTPSDCVGTAQIPPCVGTSYTICELSFNVYYQVEVRAHTAAGYGEPFKQKIFTSR